GRWQADSGSKTGGGKPCWHPSRRLSPQTVNRQMERPRRGRRDEQDCFENAGRGRPRRGFPWQGNQNRILSLLVVGRWGWARVIRCVWSRVISPVEVFPGRCCVLWRPCRGPNLSPRLRH